VVKYFVSRKGYYDLNEQTFIVSIAVEHIFDYLDPDIHAHRCTGIDSAGAFRSQPQGQPQG